MIMTKEEQQLFCADLCARLPYEVKVEYRGEPITLDYALFAKKYSLAFGQYHMKFNLDKLDTIKPYLRPMSSMTEDEMVDYGRLKLSSDKIYDLSDYKKTGKGFVNIHTVNRKTGKKIYTFQVNRSTMLYDGYVGIDWLNAHHFDYRGLIPIGLALEAPEGLYND